MGPVRLNVGSTEDVEDILSSMPALSLSSPLGLVMWSAVRAKWRMRCSHKFDPQPCPPHWNHFLRTWVNTLEPWMEHPTPTLPHFEIKMLLHGLGQLEGPDSLLDHPRANKPGSRPPTTLHYPARKRSKKQGHEAALREYFEDVIRRYAQEGWEIIYPVGSLELHPTAERVGGYGVFFGDARDVAEPLPPDEEQTNNSGELRAAVAALRGHKWGSMSLVCPDSTYVVDGVLGRAQKWRHHKWQTSSGLAHHVDLWTQVLDILEEIGLEVQWQHVLLHVGIRGNEKADSLADDGRRRSPLLRGHVSAGPTVHNDEEPPPPHPMEVMYQEPPAIEEDPPPPPQQPQTLVRMDRPVDGTPCRQQPSTPAVVDIEVLRATPGRKHRRLHSPSPPRVHAHASLPEYVPGPVPPNAAVNA